MVVVEGPRLYGPFGTHHEAEKALMNSKIPNFEINAERLEEEGLAIAAEGRAMILPMMGPLAMAKKATEFDREARLFSNHLCSTCEHKLVKHSATNNHCMAPGCSCPKPKPVNL